MNRKKSNADSITTGAIIHQSNKGLQSFEKTEEMVRSLLDEANKWKNATPEQLAGRLAEIHHAGTFNKNAVSAGMEHLKAKTGSQIGQPTAAQDISIFRYEQEVVQAQVKYHGTSARTTFHVSRTKYDGMQKIVPSDQVNGVQRIAKRRGIDGLGKRNYPDTAQNASSQLKFEEVSSQPLSRQQAIDIAKKPSQYSKNLLRTELNSATKSGALTGAVFGGGISVISNINSVCTEQKSGSEAILDVVKDTSASALTGAACAGGSVLIKQSLVKSGAQSLARGSAPVALAMGGVEVLSDFGRLASGSIDGEEFISRTGKTAVRTGTSWGGMELGSGIGTAICPGVGTVVGGLLGGIFGALFGNALTS